MKFLAKLFFLIIMIPCTIHSMNVPPLKLSNTEVKTLEKALNSEINGNKTFYTSRTPQELQEVISVSNKLAQDNGLMQYYAKAYKVTIPELLQVIKKIILKATQRALLKKTKAAKKVKQPKPGKKKKQAKVPKIAQATLITPQFKLLSEFIEQDYEGNDDFFLNAQPEYLENIIKNALEVLQSDKQLTKFSIEVGINKVESAEDLKAAIKNARWALDENASVSEPDTLSVVIPTPIMIEKNAQQVVSAIVPNKYKMLSEYLNSDKPESFDEKAIEKIAREITQDDNELAAFAREFGVEKSDALALLQVWKLEEPKNVPVQQPIFPAIPVKKIPAAVQQIPVGIEDQEEEIQANQLYIGLDVKETNAQGDPILWQNTIRKLTPQLGDAQFLPNDYFHITIAWIESKNPISPEIIAKVERALTHATEILKIVFPQGIHGVGLSDGAMMLGKSAVVFRVAESIELKKLQEIILRFLAFDTIQGINYNTFQKDSPLHVTLGKIKYGKYVPDLKTVVANLSAPEGLRASRGQSSIINTFRLTYSQAGLAWQERMSYRF